MKENTEYKIEIINNTIDRKYRELESLIKDFAIHIFIVQKFNLYNKTNSDKKNILKNYKAKLSDKELQVLEEDIQTRIQFAKDSINNKDKSKLTRYYVLLKDDEVISFQTAQIRKKHEILEGWRNFAYIKPTYSGKQGNVKDTYNNVKYGFLSNALYDNIEQWFKENGVKKEKTATGRNMYKNILVYIVLKGFIPERKDENRIYLIKDYNDKKTKKELKEIYKNIVTERIIMLYYEKNSSNILDLDKLLNKNAI